MSRSWKQGSSRRWRKLRAAILYANVLETGGACQVAIPKVCTGQADTVHHVKGKAVTGDDPRYLVAACTACNRKLGNPANVSPRPRKITRW